MSIAVLEFTKYDDDGWHYEVHRLVHPAWEAIEQAIRRLDRAKYPFVWIFNDEETNESRLPNLNVIGGSGAYGVDGNLDESQLIYYDPAQSPAHIKLWITDQGYETTCDYVCFDVETVLKIVRYFEQTGQFDPAYLWKAWP